MFSDRFDHRLGLTATLERQDGGVDTYILPYFESRIAGCDFGRGRRDNVLAPVRVMTVAIDFTTEERQKFDEHDAIAREARKNLISKYGCAAAPFGAFMQDVTVLAEQREVPEGRLASRYMSAFSKRRSLLADCRGKLDALAALAPALAQSDRSIVFSETKLSAEAGAAALRDKGVKSSVYSSGLDRLARTRVLQQFRAGALTNLVAPRVLDEGIDVPSVDVGVIVASNSSRRQMIQRMGRVLRLKPGDRAAAFVILYVPRTMEDPALGAHEAFLEQLLDVAEEQVNVSLEDAAGLLTDWLSRPFVVNADPVVIREAPVSDDGQPAETVVALPESSGNLDLALLDLPGGRDAALRYVATLPVQSARVAIQVLGLDGAPAHSVEQAARHMATTADEVIAIRRTVRGGFHQISRTSSP